MLPPAVPASSVYPQPGANSSRATSAVRPSPRRRPDSTPPERKFTAPGPISLPNPDYPIGEERRAPTLKRPTVNLPTLETSVVAALSGLVSVVRHGSRLLRKDQALMNARFPTLLGAV